MNSVKIYIANTQSNLNEILINGQVLDLFESETIPFTLKQTDLSDLGSNYANFTKDFIIPASKRNNKTLKYWLDTKNDNQFQSTVPIPARIDISGIFFSLGSIKIISFNTDETGAPKNYTITYTGSLSSLKTLFGDSLVSDLPIGELLGSDIIPFGDFNVMSNIVYDTTPNKPIEIPLISTKRIIPNYTTVKFTTGVDNPNGIKRGELRPALKFRSIFEAIQAKYGVTFTGNFYDDEMLDKLYLWLNKNDSIYTSGGTVVELTGTPSSTSTIEYRPNSGSSDSSKGYVSLIYADSNIKEFTLKYEVETVNDNTKPYRGKVQEVLLNTDGTIDELKTREQPNFGIVSTSEFKKGQEKPLVTYRIKFQGKNIPIGQKRHFRFIAETENENTVVIITYFIRIETRFLSTPSVAVTNFFPTNTTEIKNVVTISDNIPEITVQDFLTSLIKMFNLVIVPKFNNTYELDYYTNYYANGSIIDITKYCTPLKKINKVKTYKELSFKYEDSEYAANKNYKSRQLTTREYGEIKQTFKDGDIDSLKIEPKFNLILFRELDEIDFTSDTELNNTWLIGDGTGTDNSIISDKATIFFYNGKANILDNKYLAYTTDIDDSVAMTTYSQFSNLDDLLDYNTTLCFSTESMFGESFDQSLYLNNYSRLISAVVSPYAREFEIDAVLPKHIFTTISLNNQLVIGNEVFSISEISVDLLTGKAKLKLNNLIRS